MRILVTGGSGQLGQCIKEVVRTQNVGDLYDFIFLGREELDIGNRENISEILDRYSPTFVVNCAAFVDTVGAEEKVQLAYLTNAIGPLNLAEKCNEIGAKLIHISTDMVFDGNQNTPYYEFQTCVPINVYGASKYVGEELIKRTMDNYVIIRTSWLYSEYGNNFVTKVMKLLKNDGEYEFTCDQVSCPTYAMNLARFIVHLIVDEKNCYGVYHFTDMGIASRYDFAHEISILTKSGDPTQYNDFKIVPCDTLADDKIRRQKYTVLSTEKARKSFPNFRFENWRVALKRCIDKIQKKQG